MSGVATMLSLGDDIHVQYGIFRAFDIQ